MPNPDKLEIFKGTGVFSVPPRGISALKHVAPQASHITLEFFCHKKEHDALRARASQLRSIINISTTLFFR